MRKDTDGEPRERVAEHEQFFTRVNTKVTRAFKRRLRWACLLRARETARNVPEGEILSELGQFLTPHPDEEPINGAAPRRTKGRPRTAAKKTAAKKTVRKRSRR